MSQRNRLHRITAVASIAAMSTIAFGGTASAGQGPVCEDNEEPVCEEPPAPTPTAHTQGHLTLYFPDFGGVLLIGGTGARLTGGA